MTADPEPMDALIGWQPEGSIVEADSHTVELTTGQSYELQRGMGGIGLQQGKVFIGEILDPWW